MTIVGIISSPHKNGPTAFAVNAILDAAKAEGKDVKVFSINPMADRKGCQACNGCKRNGGTCVIKDDLTPVLEAVRDAESLVISAPVYFGDVPGMVRNLFERLWFPGLMYRRDGACAYDKKVKVGLIYTMNCPDEHFYDSLIGGHKNTFERFFGETKVVCATETLQFDNYDLYVGDMFDVPRRQEKHEKVFPEDCRRAFEMGRELVK